MQTTLYECLMDSVLSDATRFGNLSESRSFRTHGYSLVNIPRQRFVLSGVRPAVHESKIINAVIQRVMVDVVNDFRGQELPPNVVLHDEAMLKDFLAVDAEGSISTAVDTPSAPIGIMAERGTEVISIAGDARRRPGKQGFTKGTINFRHAAIISS